VHSATYVSFDGVKLSPDTDSDLRLRAQGGTLVSIGPWIHTDHKGSMRSTEDLRQISKAARICSDTTTSSLLLQWQSRRPWKWRTRSCYRRGRISPLGWWVREGIIFQILRSQIVRFLLAGQAVPLPDHYQGSGALPHPAIQTPDTGIGKPERMRGGGGIKVWSSMPSPCECGANTLV